MSQRRQNFRSLLAVTALATMLAITILFPDQRLLAAKQAPQRQTTSRAVQPNALDWETLTEQQFKQLPDSQPITFEGKPSTLGEVRAKARAQQQQMQKRAAAQAKMVRNKAPSPARSSIDQLLRTQQHKFAAEETKVQTELKRLRRLGPATIHGKTTTELRVSTQKPSGFDTIPPRITKMLGIIQPGGVVLIGGNNFGNKPGVVRMIVPNATWDLKLENLEWYPTGIGGGIPNMPSLVKGAGVLFVVETSAGAKSNEWPVNWVMEVKRLPQADVWVDSCSRDANSNRCNSRTTHSGCLLHYPVWVKKLEEPDAVSFFGRHTNCWGAAGDDSGVDVYEINLKNGWVLERLEFGSGVTDEGEGWVHGPSGFAKGSTSWKPSIAWSVTPSDTVAYWGRIYIHGPRGVSHSQQYPGEGMQKAQEH